MHINRSHSLRSGLSVRANESLRNELMGRRNDQPGIGDRFIVETTIAKVAGGKVFRRRKENPQRSVTVSGLHDEGMLARANKIKAMFGVQLKEQATLPGISREKTGEYLLCVCVCLCVCMCVCVETVALMLARLEFQFGDRIPN